MDLTELDRQFTPSAWSKRFPESVGAVENHICVAAEESLRNSIKFKCKRNMMYGQRDMECMDLYYKDQDYGTPIIVFIHGGYWQQLTKNESAYCVGPLVERDCRVIILDYELCPNVPLKEIVNEIQTAIGAILEYAHDSGAQNVVLIGHSAGAHLIMSALERDFNTPKLSLISAIFLISGLYDLRNLHKTNINKLNILGLTEEIEISLSPILKNYLHLKQFYIQFFIYVAENDTPTFVKQSFEFHHLLSRFNLKSEIFVIKDCDHFDIVENLMQCDYEITINILHSVNKW